ncbi:MAG: flagellar biosynthesis protein FlgF [Sphingomonas sp. SCN 67-18]|uniref:flagellar basal body rod protein FlgF n=1 Tax=uncultured Sphingomonas sp. TaxID=158754 RepID=UPI00086AC899|nr:flagellar basal body rod protein FlgF [Sphingomonas sp. SCN 67-18]ODU21578.1 MAG: flagellar biosynthesis protein FlgF [Sphingomonas sp. SCN 67-18]
MDKLVYTAYSGLRGHMAAQAAIANNMANASTIGFRADKVAFERLSLVGPTFESRAPTSEEVIDADRHSGAVTSTGRALDIAVNGDAWLAVQAADGSEGYTKRGDLMIAPSGMLQTGDGFPVMGQSGPITIPPSIKTDIAADGSVLIVPPGGEIDKPQVIDRLKLVSPAGTETLKGMDNLLKVKGGGALPQDLDAKVTSGALEQSNVNMTQALVDMIENQRSYEVQAKLLSTAKDMDEGGASVMRMPG